MQKKIRVDLLVFNTTVYTVNDSFDVTHAFAIKDGKFLDIGTNEEILGKYSADTNLNAVGKYIYPGFNDAHCHFYGYGMGLIKNADLRGTKSQEEIIERLKAFRAQNKFDWLTGRSWDQNDWEVKEFPTTDILDKAFPDVPVYLTRVDGHAAWVNTKALELAGINSATKVEGGDVILINGKPSGVLIDNAMDLVRKIIPDSNREMDIKALLGAQEDCFKLGLTSVTDCGLSYNTVKLIDSLNKSGDLYIRINAMLNPTEKNFTEFVKKGPYITDRLSVRTIKVYADGALGSRGALMLEPYSDAPKQKGLQIESKEYYQKVCKLAFENNYQMSTHAIGDAANRLMLEIYGEQLKEKNDKRWRIEHAQIIHPDDFTLFEKYSIIPSIQPTHATSDMYWAKDRVGEERIKGAYAYKQLLATNNWIPSGTDFPVEEVDPIKTFYAAISRKDSKGWPPEGFQKENALSRWEAMRSMTIWAAKSSFEENVKGSIEVGKYADFVVLEGDLMRQTEYDIINKNKVIATYVGGKKVFSSMKRWGMQNEDE